MTKSVRQEVYWEVFLRAVHQAHKQVRLVVWASAERQTCRPVEEQVLEQIQRPLRFSELSKSGGEGAPELRQPSDSNF